MLLAEMLKQVQHDCHSDENRNLFIIAEMLKQVQHDVSILHAFNPSILHSFTPSGIKKGPNFTAVAFLHIMKKIKKFILAPGFRPKRFLLFLKQFFQHFLHFRHLFFHGLIFRLYGFQLLNLFLLLFYGLDKYWCKICVFH